MAQVFTFMFLHADGVDSNNNGVGRINRGFAAIRSDSGGSRSEDGMRVASVLFIICTTCSVWKKSSYRRLT